jgi:hypothetical protein
MASILLHHDAITGTHSVAVKIDYEQRMTEAKSLLKQNNEKLLNNYALSVGRPGETKLNKISEALLRTYSRSEVTLRHLQIFNP